MSKKISVAEKKRRKAKYEKERYTRNRKRILAQQKEYYDENRQAIRDSRVAYYKAYNKKHRKIVDPKTDRRFKANRFKFT